MIEHTLANDFSDDSATGFCLNILSPPWRQGAFSALCFAQSVLKQQYPLKRIFFSDEGVFIANYAQGDHLMAQRDSPARVSQLWKHFAENEQLSLYFCQSALDYYGINTEHLHPPLVPGSLGQLISAYADKDRVIVFQP